MHEPHQSRSSLSASPTRFEKKRCGLPEQTGIGDPAAETERVEHHARLKLVRKGLNLIAANQVGVEIAFAMDDNALLLLDRSGATRLPQMRKPQLARALIKQIGQRFHAENTIKDTRRAHR